MKKVLQNIGDKFSIYLLTLMIGGLVLFYYFYYVPSNQSQLNDHAFRILDNKAKTIVEKYSVYTSAIRSAPISYLAKWYFQLNPDTVFYVKNLDTTATSRKVVFSIHPKDSSAARWTRISAKLFKYNARVDSTLKVEVRGPETKGPLLSVWKVTGGQSYFVLNSGVDFYREEQNRGALKEIPIYPEFWVSISDFTARIKSNDVFNDLFVIRSSAGNATDKASSEDMNASDVDLVEETAGMDHHILDKSGMGLVRLVLPDSVDKSGAGVYTQMIEGQSYRVYYKLTTLRKGLDVYVVGLIKQSQFTSLSLQVPPWFVIFCSLGCLILLFLFPVLKLFFLNEYERLSTADVSMGVFSIIVCTCLLTLILAGSDGYQQVEKAYVDKNLVNLSSQISRSVSAELPPLENVLSLSLSGKLTKDYLGSVFNGQKFTEVFSLDFRDGHMRKIYLNDGTSPKLDIFPVSIRQRQYYQDIKSNPHQDFTIEAVNSYFNNSSEIALSGPATAKNEKDIKVITSPFKSLVNATVPKPYKFAVLDETGAVQFHSDWKEPTKDNFLHELDDPDMMRAYLKKQIKGYISFNYLRKDCWGYSVPLVKNWSLLVYYETSNSRDLAAEVFTMCMISLLILIGYLTLIHFIISHDQPKMILLKTRPFFYDWLNPYYFSADDWKKLAIRNLALYFVEVVCIVWLKGLCNFFLMTLIIITFSYLMNYKLLNGSSPSVKSSTALRNLIFVPVILLGLVQYKTWDWKNASLAAAVLIVLYLFNKFVFKRPIKRIPPSDEREKIIDINKKFRMYRFFMLAWLVVLSIGPTVGFLTKHYYSESIIRRFAFLMEDYKITKDDSGNTHYSFLQNSPSLSENFPKSGEIDFSLYYSLFPRLTAADSVDGLEFNEFPASLNIRRDLNDTAMQVSGSSDSIIRTQNSLKDFAFDPNAAFFMCILLLFVVAAVLWWMLLEIPKKIFYIPEHHCWTMLPAARIAWGDPLFEYEDIAHPIHPLHFNADNVTTPDTTTAKEEWLKEKKIVDIQKEYAGHYRQLWNGCTNLEKMFLYDLAEDGIANQSNKNVIGSLAEKGLIRLYPRLEVTNVSFANYLRQSVPIDEIKTIAASEGKKGGWSDVRILLVIVIISGIAFVSVAGQGFLVKLSTLLGSVMLFLPKLIEFLGSTTKILKAPGQTP